MSYRHGFHAGNHADVLKHALLTLAVQALQGSGRPIFCLDTHAGAGRYDLHSETTRKNAGHESGIGRLWPGTDAPAALEPYLTAVRTLNPEGGLRHYPGSPALLRRLLRPEDRLVLCELHPAEHAALQALFAGDRQVAVHRQDGYQILRALLPPKEHRGLVLIDPPYEVESEYGEAVGALCEAIRHWPGGVYVLWYPLLPESLHQSMLEALRESGVRKVLQVELSVRPTGGPGGMRGSGLLLVNPTRRLDAALEGLLPWLWERLSPEGGGDWRVRWLVPA